MWIDRLLRGAKTAAYTLCESIKLTPVAPPNKPILTSDRAAAF